MEEGGVMKDSSFIPDNRDVGGREAMATLGGSNGLAFKVIESCFVVESGR